MQNVPQKKRRLEIQRVIKIIHFFLKKLCKKLPTYMEVIVYLHCQYDTTTKKTNTMKTEILNSLTERRALVEKRHLAMVQSAERNGKSYITAKKFFFNVVADYFENMSKVMTNKCLKSDYKFICELNKAIEKAEYACACPQRNNNKSLYTQSI